MRLPRHTPTRRVAGALVIAVLAGVAVPDPSAARTEADVPPRLREAPRTWAIDANTVRIDDPIETGDEPYVATVAFQVTLGTAGTARSWLLGGVQPPLANEVRAGAVLTIPDMLGRATFRLARVDAIDIQNGRRPVVVGTVTAAFESNGTSTADRTRTLDTLTSWVRTAVTTLERMQINDLGALATSSDQRLEFLDRLVTHLQLLDHDLQDLIGPQLPKFNETLVALHANVQVGMLLDDLGGLVQLIGFLLPGSGILGNRGFRLTFTGADFRGNAGRYTVDYSMSMT
jgi:hypothetical protein